LTPESRTIAIRHAWIPDDAVQADLSELWRLVEVQIALAVAVKEERVLALVKLWERAYRCHDRQGEHNAIKALARECGGDIAPFRGIPAHK
jgi:hypothetical protein